MESSSRIALVFLKAAVSAMLNELLPDFPERGMAYEGLVKTTKTGPKWTSKIRTIPELLEAPLKWKKSQIDLCQLYERSFS